MDVFTYHNKQFYNSNVPLVSPLDLSVIRGYAICDTFRTYNKTPFLLTRHINRFLSGAKQFTLSIDYSAKDLETLIIDMIERCPFSFDEIMGKLIITPGVTSDTYYSPSLSPQLFIVLKPFKPFPTPYYEKGVALHSLLYKRPMPNTKHTNYRSALHSLFHHHNTFPNQPTHDALYIDEHGQISEAGTSNFFVIHKGSLYTAPDQNVLNGITRDFVITLAKEHNIPVNFTFPQIKEMNSYSSAFITSCNRGIMPIASIDSHVFSDPVSCKTLQKLRSLMNKYIIKNYFYNSVDV